MASRIITSIDSALDCLQWLQALYPDLEVNLLKILMHKLRSLRTFLLCSTKLGNDHVHLRTEDNNIDNTHRNLGSLLVRVEDAVCRNENNILSYCVVLEDEMPFDVQDKVANFLFEIESFAEEIDNWYFTLSDCLQPSSNFPMVSQVKHIVDSVTENLQDFLSFHRAYIGFLVEPVEDLIENITFWRNFIRFATLRCGEEQEFQDLLTRAEALAISAAHLTVHLFSSSHYNIEVFSMNGGNSRRNLNYDGMKVMLSELLQRMKPVNFHVNETYTRVLASFKSSRESHTPTPDMNDDPLLIIRDFIVFLISTLWEMLQSDSGTVVSLKDQLQAVYGGLRSIRILLEKQPNKFDDKVRDVTGAAICDAGVIIFSLYQKDDFAYDLVVSDFLESIKAIRTQVEGQSVETSKFNFPKTNVLGFLDFLLENLMEVKSSMVDTDTKTCVQTIGDDLVFLRSFLGVLAALQTEQEDLQTLWNHAVEVAYKMEFLIDQLRLGGILDSFPASFESITEDIKIMKTDAMKMLDGRRLEIEVQTVTTASTQVPSPSSAPAADEVVGFGTETKSIIDRLTRGSRKLLQVVSIVGMPGSGKTTLATKVYNDPSIRSRFHVRAWCSISQVFNRRKILLELLNQVLPKLPDGHSKMTEHDLAQELRRSLKQRRYLIFMDDIWDNETFKSLKESLPDDSNESRILLTSRHCDVAPKDILDKPPLCVRELTGDESLELLQRKVFSGKDWPPSLYEFGVKIAKSCKGLPLTIVIVAGLLASTEKEVWKEVLESLRSGIIYGRDQCKSTIELSYKHLADHLKPCLLSFGAFPEDQEVSVKRLIWLWIAEGFIRKTESKSEEVARGYLNSLIEKNLVMHAKERSTGGVKACRTHDLLHDFCLEKAKEENFLQLLKGVEELSSFDDPGNLRRLCIYSKPEQFKESKLFCPHLRSLVFFDPKAWNGRRLDVSFICRIFKLLIVLDMEQVNLQFHFPSEIGLLVQLRYLAIQGTANVSPSIGNLLNLETFILRSAGTSVILPDTVWNLQKLRHLYLTDADDDFSGIQLPYKNLRSSGNLFELDSLSALFSRYWYIMEKQLRKFPNIRQLKGRLSEYGDDDSKVMSFSFLSQLESLDVSFFKNFTQFEFVFPETIKKLSLGGCGLQWTKISTIAKLPNLEVLKLLYGSFIGETWHVEEGEFPKLRFLKLESLDIVKWTASDDDDQMLINLQEMVLESCNKLEEIPECLENSLEMIEVINCPDRVASLVEQIRANQDDMGNLVRVYIKSIKKDTW